MMWTVEDRVTRDCQLFISLGKCMCVCVASAETLGLDRIFFCLAILSQ